MSTDFTEGRRLKRDEFDSISVIGTQAFEVLPYGRKAKPALASDVVTARKHQPTGSGEVK
jgi:hypothetical protein